MHKALFTTRIVYAAIVCAAVLWCAALTFGQEKTSTSKTETTESGGKKVASNDTELVEESNVNQERTVSGRTETTQLRGLGGVLGDTNLESEFSCGEGTLTLKHGPFITKFKRP